MGRSIELTGLAHRKHYRAQQNLEHWMRMQFDTIPVSKSRYEKMSVPAQKAVVQGINRAASALQMKRPPLARQERDLIRVENDRAHEPLGPAQRAGFRIRQCPVTFRGAAGKTSAARLSDMILPQLTGGIIGANIHSAACRWVYPLIEGRAPETHARRVFAPQLADMRRTDDEDAPGAGAAPGTGTPA